MCLCLSSDVETARNYILRCMSFWLELCLNVGLDVGVQFSVDVIIVYVCMYTTQSMC